jgi:GNAT superfamily N-acetyltransferase
MIQQIESNDNGFTGVWSDTIHLDCGLLFLNPKLVDDVFFDKLTGVTCISQTMIDKSVEQFQKNHSKPYVYSLNYPEFENLLRKKGFTYHDTQHVLKKRATPTKKSDAIKITSDNTTLWASIFCKSYDCLDWAGSVNSILENSLHHVDYFVDKSHSSCMALYQKDFILGLYCLGTMPDKRNQGNASTLIDFALYEANSRNLEFLILETYEMDGLMEFYSKLGFEKLYHKTVFTI